MHLNLPKKSYNIVFDILIYDHFFSIFLPALAFGLGFLPPLPPATTTKLAYLLLNFILLRALPLGFFFDFSYLSTFGVYFLTF